MNRPVVLVAGLGRCGSSLTMQMLAAGGLPCVGRFPDFEHLATDHRPVDPVWFADQAGRAMKLLDPHLTPIPDDTPAVVVWLDRDPNEQAKSQAKLAHQALGLPAVGRSTVRAWAANLVRDRREARQALAGRPQLKLDYADLVLRAEASAGRLADFLAPWFGPLDRAAMVAAVIPKASAACAPDLAIEESLIAKAQAETAA